MTIGCDSETGSSSDGVSSGKEGPVGVFDSGVGGLTVARAIVKFMPHEHILYLGDTARVPYGTKSPRTVTRYALENARMLIEYGAKVIVIACNTASAVAFKTLCETVPIPVIDVVQPGARAAAAATDSLRVGLIGTRGTIQSMAYERHLHAINPRIKVFSVPCPLFVPLAEEGRTEGIIPETAAREYLNPLLERHIDVLILGCTHYPLLKNVIGTICGPAVTLIDSAEAAAADLGTLIRHRGLARDDCGAVHHRFFVTDLPDQFETVAGRFFGRERIDLDLVDLPVANVVGREPEPGDC